MNSRGITWAANIYQKFEAMCLEVEELIQQDTAKYVENQVQSVGACVKKFYSDVMEDFLPPSHDPGKVKSFEMLEQFNDVEVCKKPKPLEVKEPLKVDITQLRKRPKAPSHVQNSSDIVAPGSLHDVTMLKGLAESEVASASSGNNDFCSSQVLQRNFVTSRKESPLACLGLSDCTQHDPIGHNSDEAETRDEVTRDPSMHPLPCCTSLPESGLVQNIEWEKTLSSSEGFSVVSHDSFGASCKTKDFCSNIHEETRFSIQEHGTVDHSNKEKLEESCILVNEDDLRFISPKSRPYKKKICDAFYSKKRGSRTQEYKQLATEFANTAKCHAECTSSSALALISSTRHLQSSRLDNLIGESEWEFL
ncbi:hypothetical protein SAY86_012439 [Trapa natans]|uniref:Uncharacterized protein n=1 Tax=Trapa natans TaxID=22666 RepID=A0AAN7LX54_TRANT|nr:hypothetical protein SAY86_012439 [Trapa natans]